jgi:hypothetical protein
MLFIFLTARWLSVLLTQNIANMIHGKKVIPSGLHKNAINIKKIDLKVISKRVASRKTSNVSQENIAVSMPVIAKKVSEKDVTTIENVNTNAGRSRN